MLKKLDFHIKKTFGYRERSEVDRKKYEEEIKEIPFEDRVYLDEAGIDDNEVCEYGWGKRKERLLCMKNSLRNTRYSVIGSLVNNVLIAPFVFTGMCDRAVFELYLEKVLIPVLKPGQWVIMDNASFHKGGKIKKLIEAAGCFLKYLPSYSPDFNPIEHHWEAVKSRFKKKFQTRSNNICEVAKYAFAIN